MAVDKEQYPSSALNTCRVPVLPPLCLGAFVPGYLGALVRHSIVVIGVPVTVPGQQAGNSAPYGLRVAEWETMLELHFILIVLGV